MSAANVLMAPVADVESRAGGGVRMDVVPISSGRVKRVIYEPGFKWSTHMKPVVGTGLCMHAHAPDRRGIQWSAAGVRCLSDEVRMNAAVVGDQQDGDGQPRNDSGQRVVEVSQGDREGRYDEA